jgi:hypothetical protein
LEVESFRFANYFRVVKVKDVKDAAKRQPFRPFAVRLNNGARYLFERSDDLGAPKDFRMIFYFGNNQAVRIDTESIVEIMEVP